MKYETISFEFPRELTESEEKIFHYYFRDMYEKLRKALELFADKDKHRDGAGLNNIIVKKIMEINRKMPNGMDMTFFIEAKAKALLFDYDRLMVLDKNGRVYTFQLAKDQFSMGKTGVGYLDDQYVNLFHRSQSQITNDIRRLVLPRLHFSSNQVNIQYGIQDIPELA
jgi:hypothetical protein